MSPSYRSREDYCPKTVKFADGVLPGEGTSPSGGEEIHSPPPPITGTKGLTGKKREKRLRKKRKMKVKVIKLYTPEQPSSPPPPPPGSPPFTALKLFPGYTHYSIAAQGTAVIYTQQHLQKQYAFNTGGVALPGVMVAGGTAAAGAGGGVATSPTTTQGVYGFPGYVYTTLYSTTPMQYVLPTPTAIAGGGGGGGGKKKSED